MWITAIDTEWRKQMSPDELVSCFCCGEGLLEIKCPYSTLDEDPTSVQQTNFVWNLVQGGLKLVRSNNYYYQIQGQLTICKLSYCDFVCWTPKGIHIKRIERDDVFCQGMLVWMDFFRAFSLELPHTKTRKMNLHSCKNTSPSFPTATRENWEGGGL